MQVQATAGLVASAGTEIRPPFHVAEIATMLGVHQATIYRDIAAGRLKALRVGKGKGALRILPAALDAYLAQLEVRAVSAPAVAGVA